MDRAGRSSKTIVCKKSNGGTPCLPKPNNTGAYECESLHTKKPQLNYRSTKRSGTNENCNVFTCPLKAYAANGTVSNKMTQD